MHAEMSYDLVMCDEMEFIEGTYRLPGENWQVVIVLAHDRDVAEPEIIPTEWDSGVTGLVLRFPQALKINALNLERVLSISLGVTKWQRVRGPDSMDLR